MLGPFVPVEVVAIGYRGGGGKTLSAYQLVK